MDSARENEMNRIWIAFLCVVPLALAGCASPILKPGETAQIVGVTVTKGVPNLGTENLVEAVRYKTQNAAFRFSEQGPEKTLKLDITGMAISSPGRALLVDGSSVITANVTLIDKASGMTGEPFVTMARIPRLSGIIGALAATNVDPIQEEQHLSGMLAEEVMKRIYGADYAETVASRISAKSVSPKYPMSYEKARRKLKCDQIRRDIENEKLEAEERGEPPDELMKLPADCKASIGINPS